ncbi:MAG: hypothetical protein KDB27_36410, partial [Planctomycetales bacterium]|nr:hypothetical protein [Planctomycetales bacterium]
MKSRLFFASLIFACHQIQLANAQDLQALKYNNESLVVDLGVGLWAWPLPIDFDDDGDVDLLVSCPDKPYDGLYYFERTGSATTPFKRAKRISKGLRNVRMWNGLDSKGDRQFRLFGENVEYLGFQSTGFDRAQS